VVRSRHFRRWHFFAVHPVSVNCQLSVNKVPAEISAIPLVALETRERVGHTNGFIAKREAILAAFICVSDERKELIYMSRLLSTKGHPMRNEASRGQGDEDTRMRLKDGEVTPINKKQVSYESADEGKAV